MSMKGRQTMDHERASFNLVRLKKSGKTFELAVDADKAVEFREKKSVPIREIVRSQEHIFSDVKDGVLANEHDLANIFGTMDFEHIARIILTDGQIQLTAEHRQKVREAKRRKIIDLIVRNAMDPKTKFPHPPTRIENAMEEARVKIDEFKSPEDQLDGIVKALRSIIPISMELKKLSIMIPAPYAGKAVALLRQFAKPTEERWQDDGSYMCVMEIPAGLEADFYDRLKHATDGYIEAHTTER